MASQFWVIGPFWRGLILCNIVGRRQKFDALNIHCGVKFQRLDATALQFIVGTAATPTAGDVFLFLGHGYAVGAGTTLFQMML